MEVTWLIFRPLFSVCKINNSVAENWPGPRLCMQQPINSIFRCCMYPWWEMRVASPHPISTCHYHTYFCPSTHVFDTFPVIKSGSKVKTAINISVKKSNVFQFGKAFFVLFGIFSNSYGTVTYCYWKVACAWYWYFPPAQKSRVQST